MCVARAEESSQFESNSGVVDRNVVGVTLNPDIVMASLQANPQSGAALRGFGRGIAAAGIKKTRFTQTDDESVATQSDRNCSLCRSVLRAAFQDRADMRQGRPEPSPRKSLALQGNACRSMRELLFCDIRLRSLEWPRRYSATEMRNQSQRTLRLLLLVCL